VVEDYDRRFRNGSGVRQLKAHERARVEKAFASYLETIPESKRMGSLTYALKDVVGKSGFGIGSAGLPAYSLLVEGHTEALENDVVLTMKQGNVAAPSRIVHDARADAFHHHGHRTVLSQRALQAHADPWLGWTELEGATRRGTGFVVSEYSPYEKDLDWGGVTEPDELARCSSSSAGPRRRCTACPTSTTRRRRSSTSRSRTPSSTPSAGARTSSSRSSPLRARVRRARAQGPRIVRRRLPQRPCRGLAPAG
jgi:hypothetical protein